MSSPDSEADGSVCYRHPDRPSWTLCQRCGRTICPECQILTPNGVRCPDCVRETGGSVRWEPTASRSTKAAPKRKRGLAAVPATATGSSPRWVQALREMVRPGSSSPTASWGIMALIVVLWIVGFVSANLPFVLLAASPGTSWQIWRFFTAELVYPAAPAVILSVLLSGLFFLLTAPGVERQLGRQRFLVVFLAASAFGAAAMVLAGATAFGLSAALWGMLGAYLVLVWPHPQARTRFLILMGIYLLISLLFGGYSLPAIIGGALAGIGATYLFRRYDDRPRSRPSTPYLLITAGVAGLILIAILRTLVLG